MHVTLMLWMHEQLVVLEQSSFPAIATRVLTVL